MTSVLEKRADVGQNNSVVELDYGFGDLDTVLEKKMFVLDFARDIMDVVYLVKDDSKNWDLIPHFPTSPYFSQTLPYVFSQKKYF